MTKLFLMALLATLISCKGASTPATGDGDAQQVEATQPAEQTVRILSNNQFEAKMAEYQAAGTPFQLIDVRTPAELAETGFIPGAANIDFYEADFKNRIGALDRDQPVMLYCRSGNRSGQASKLLLDMGFTEVYDMAGGMVGWNAAGKAVEMPEPATAE